MAPHRILVSFSLLMISTKRRTRSCFVRTIILVGVIACLCFSVGEGLRLRPFPVSGLAETEATNTQLYATGSYETSPYKYGPLDVPTRVQNRGKRQVVDYGNPPSQSSRELTAHHVLLPGTANHCGHCFPSFGSHLHGPRAAFHLLVLINKVHWTNLWRTPQVRSVSSICRQSIRGDH